MKKLASYLVLMALVLTAVACSDNTADAEPAQETSEESKPAEVKAAKFADVNNCSQYANIYAAIPHLDSYQNIDFHELGCQSTELDNPFSTALDVDYGDKKSRNSFNVVIYEVKGKSAAQELNTVATTKAAYTLAEQLAQNPGPKLFVKSNLTKLDYATVSIHDAPNDNELSNAIYTGAYKDTYAIRVELEMQGKIEQAQFEAYIADYLNAIKFDQLN